MKRLVLLLGLVTLLVLVNAQGENQKSTNPSQSIFQNMLAIPSITLISTGIRTYHKEVFEKLNDSNGEKLTFFVPTDRAVVSAAKVLDALLQLSGYPSLDELKKQSEEKGNKCPPELSGDQCAPWNMNIGITKEQAKAQAQLLEKFPSGYNATEIGMKFGKANVRYHIVRGEHSTSTLPAHCFLPTLLDKDFEKWVGLNGAAQVMHLENVEKAGHGTQNTTVPSDPLQERITPLKILFGAAYDPIPKDTVERLQNNASFTPGLVDNYIASVIIPDIKSANGYLHVIDRVLVLPLNSTSLMRAANLTKFEQLVKKAGLENRLNKELQNITILAPSDEALTTFMKEKGIQQLSVDNDLFYPEIDTDFFTLAAEDETKNLQNLVLHHVVQGSYYPPFVPSDTKLQALDGRTLQFRSVNPTEVTVEGIKASKYNILVRNGVMHVMDGVLPTEWKSAQPGTGGTGTTEGGTCPQPSGPVIKPIPGAQITNKTITPASLPSGKEPLPSARDLGCPESDAVCRVIDFDFLQCKTQYHTLAENDRNKCNRFSDEMGTSFPNKTVCYNRSTHTCVHDFFLCPLTHPQVCGVQCYNPNEYRCYATMSLCPMSAPEKCGEACYDKSKYTCKNGQLMASQSQQQQAEQQRFDADAWKLNQEVPVHSFNFKH
jgi:uncharacterized surface protein with fasciclin (FAS1) repeats